MEIVLGWLVPIDLSLWVVVTLIVGACITSAVSAAFGIGGGVLLLAILSTLLPATVVIPLHGLVQLGSNANRSLFMARHINWQALYWFVPGVVFGAALASVFLIDLPPVLLQFF